MSRPVLLRSRSTRGRRARSSTTCVGASCTARAARTRRGRRAAPAPDPRRTRRRAPGDAPVTAAGFDVTGRARVCGERSAAADALRARRWGHEGVDAWRLRGPRAAVARAARQRTADLGEGDRGADAPPAALPRADPALGEGRRAGALEARGRRRLRAGPRRPRRSPSPRSSPRSKARNSPSRITRTTAKATASCRRCGSASTRRPAGARTGDARRARRAHDGRPPRRHRTLIPDPR